MHFRDNLSAGQVSSLVVLRIFIGWHFLYEGLLKLYSPAWTAKGYLLSASFFQVLFRWMASDSLIPVIDTLNIAALVAVGVCLLLGFQTRGASLLGIGLLLLYYFAHPPFPGLPQGPSEGSYWLINKNLIEAAALYVLYLFPTEYYFGIMRLKKRNQIQHVSH